MINCGHNKRNSELNVMLFNLLILSTFENVEDERSRTGRKEIEKGGDVFRYESA
jgi:hypothetical protein